MRQWMVTALALLLVGCASGGATQAWPAGGEGVLAAVKRHEAAFSNRDLGAMMEGVSPDIEWYSIDGADVTLELRGRESLRDAMFTYFAETPSFRSEIEGSVVSGAYVSVRERASWELKGERRSQTAIGVFEVRDGLIRRVWYYPAQKQSCDFQMIDLTVELPIRIALLEFEGLRVDDGRGGFDELEGCAARYRSGGETSPGAVPGVQVARELFRALGIDPTRRRPSSEALLNRALKGKDMPKVSNVVDVGNFCSLDFLLPLGIYDRRRFVGPVTLRKGRAGESYETIADRMMSLEDRYVLADGEGPFGSPITDSRRTAVTTATTEVAILIYAPLVYEAARLEANAGALAAHVTEHCGGVTVHRSFHVGEAPAARSAGS